MIEHGLIIGCSMDLSKSDYTEVLTGNFSPLLPPYPKLGCFDVINGQFITVFDTRNAEMLLLKPVNKALIKDWIQNEYQNQNFYLVLDRFITSKGHKRQLITNRWAEALKCVKIPKKGNRGHLVLKFGPTITEVYTITRWDPHGMRLDATNHYGTYMNITMDKWIPLPEPLQKTHNN